LAFSSNGIAINTQSPLRFGLIGCGDIGQIRARAVAQAGPFRLTAVSDLVEDRARSLASRHGAAVERSWQALVARKDVDVILVSTPPTLHATMCVQALQSGKHVLCEKPLARTPTECKDILKAAEANQRLLATGFNYRFFPSIQKARALLDSGLIGELDHVRSYAGYSAATHSHSWLRDADVMGGGALRDNGIHLLDLTRYFLGEVAEVQGFATDVSWRFPGCEDNGFALLRSSTGKIASLQASWTEWKGYRFEIALYGTKGYIQASCFPMITRVAWSQEVGGRTRRRLYCFPLTHFWERLRSYRWVVLQSFIQELRALAQELQGRPTELAKGYDGLRAVEIAHAVQPGIVPEHRAAAVRLA